MQQLSVDEEITQYTRLLLDEKIKGIHRKIWYTEKVL